MVTTKENKKDITKRYGILAVIIIAVIFLLSLFFYYFTNVAGKVRFYVAYAPFSATVTANGEPVKNNSYNYLEPGEYEFRAELDNFETVTDKATIPNGLIGIYGALEPINDAGIEIMNASRADYETIGKGSFLDSSPTPNYEIFKHLPLENSLYSITSYLDVTEKPYKYQINISAGDVYLDDAIKKLYSFEYLDKTLAAYDIQLTNYSNPFAAKSAESKATDPKQFVKESYVNIFNDREYIFADNITKSTVYTGIVMCSSKNTGGGLYRTSRVILKRNGDSWEVLGQPYPILTKNMFEEDIPTTFLNRVNRVNCYN